MLAFFLLVEFPVRLFEHRILGWINDAIDRHLEGAMKWIEPGFFYLLHTPFGLLAAAVFVILIHAYWQYLREHHAIRNITAASGVLAEDNSPIEPKPSPLFATATTLPIQSGWTKPPHNVQYVGFEVFVDDDFVTATLCFQNVPIPGKLLGKFEWPRLRVIFYDHSTGEELADMCPIVWRSDSGDPPTEIGVKKQYAEVASFFKGTLKWTAHELNEPSEDFDSWHKLNSVDLPAKDVRIIATLSGINKLRVPPVEGVLTLGEGGHATFDESHS